MFRVESLRIIPEESESAKDSQTSKDRTKQAAFVKAASNLADESANTHCRLYAYKYVLRKRRARRPPLGFESRGGNNGHEKMAIRPN